MPATSVWRYLAVRYIATQLDCKYLCRPADTRAMAVTVQELLSVSVVYSLILRQFGYQADPIATVVYSDTIIQLAILRNCFAKISHLRLICKFNLCLQESL